MIKRSSVELEIDGLNGVFCRSVNHLIIVAAPDASVAPPAQYCGGLPCPGSDTNLDNHEVLNIAPGSTILYLMYSTVRRTPIAAGIWVAFFQECHR